MTIPTAPCPWCKGKSTISQLHIQPDYYVACDAGDCGATGPIKLTLAEAIVAWNEVAALPARIAELEAALIDAAFQLAANARANLPAPKPLLDRANTIKVVGR